MSEIADTEHFTKVLCEMLETMDFSLDKQIDGNYCLEDEQEGYLGGIDSYRNFTNADEIIDRLDNFLNDYYFADLEEAAEEDFGIDFSKTDVPITAEDWTAFLDEHEDFKKSYFHEYEVMKLISSPEILELIKLDDVVRFFNPEKPKETEKGVIKNEEI